MAKEVAIYRAHKAAPLVIADDVTDESGARFDAALEVLRVPAVEPALAFVVTAMAGHRVVYETLSGMALRRSGGPARPERS